MALFSRKFNGKPDRAKIAHPFHYGHRLGFILLAAGLIVIALAFIPHAPTPLAPTSLSSLPAIHGAAQFSVDNSPMPQNSVAPGCKELIVNGDFEILGPEWETKRDARPPLHVGNLTHNDSTKAMQLGIVDLGNVESTSLIRQTVNLPENVTSITLTFYYNARVDSTRDPDDLQYVEIFNNLTGLFLTRVLTEQSNTRDWVVRQRDLMPYAGQQISIYFVVENDGENGSMAMNIDDVSIVACNPVIAATKTLTVTSVPTQTVVPTEVSTLIPPILPSPTPIPTLDAGLPTLTPQLLVPTATFMPRNGDLQGRCQNYLANGDFEAGAANFEYGTGWQRGKDPIQAQLTSTEAYGGNYAVSLGHEPNDRHGDRQTYSSIRQLVTIPQYVANMELRWRHRSNSQEEASDLPNRTDDRADVIFLDTNLKPIEIIHRQRDASNTWQIKTVEINTAKYGGRSFYVYFNVYNDGAGGRTWSYVDNIELIGCEAGATLARPVANVAPLNTTNATATREPSPTKEPTQTIMGPVPQGNVAPNRVDLQPINDESILRTTEAEPMPGYSVTPIMPAEGLQEPTTLATYQTENRGSSLLEQFGLTGSSDGPQPTSSFRWLGIVFSCLLAVIVFGLVLFLARAMFSGRNIPPFNRLFGRS